LTTGKAVIENGQLNRYQVDGGSVAIEGAGLNANNIDRFEIITRSAKINAEIQAKNLTLIAGANDVDAKTSRPPRVPPTRPLHRNWRSTRRHWAACTPGRSSWWAPKPGSG
jgi:hypothetical protein